LYGRAPRTVKLRRSSTSSGLTGTRGFDILSERRKGVVTRSPLVRLDDEFAARIRPGSGAGVLWIHPYTLDSTSWAELWEQLPGWNHIGIDLPGHGVSMPPGPKDDLPLLARRIGKLAIEKGARHLVSLSFGSLVALQVVLEYPRAFDSMVLAAPALGGGPHEEAIGVRFRELVSMFRMGGFGPHLRGRWMLTAPSLFEGLEARAELWDRLWRIVGRHGFWELSERAPLRFVTHAQTRDQLRGIEVPTLVLVGDRDLHAFKRSAEWIRRSIPRCETVELEGAGHLCLLEAPDRAARIVEDHLRGRGAEA
jgi:pimeloyl-ACP methyl ester carboxylesterase